MSWNIMRSFNFAPFHLYDEEHDGAIQFFMYDWLSLQNEQIVLPWGLIVPRLFDGQIHTLHFGTYRASLFLYMIKFVYQICVKSLPVINYNDDDEV